MISASAESAKYNYRLISCAIAICLFLGLAQRDFVAAQGQYDLSNDEGVRAALESITGKKIDPRSERCIRRDRELPIIVVGRFAFDRGCGFTGVFVKSHYVEAEDAALSKAVLEALGWKTANRKQREKLARAWVMKGLLAFSTVLSEETVAFKDRSFQAPQAVSKDNGDVVVTLWEQLRGSGRARGTTTYFLREYRFARDGDFAGDVQLDRFTAPKK